MEDENKGVADNVHAFERREVAQAVDAATKANEQATAPQVEARFELSLEGRVNLLTDLTGKAMQGLLAGDPELRHHFAADVGKAAVDIGMATLEAIERKVNELIKQGPDRG